MNESRRQDGTIPRSAFRLETGIEVLEEWAETASQTHEERRATRRCSR